MVNSLKDWNRPCQVKRAAFDKPVPLPATILVVDDNPVDRFLVGGLVEKHPGWKVCYAAQGKEALAVIEREHPQAVLTDLLMEEMDGLTLTEEIRNKHPKLPVILMTAFGSEDLAIRALRHGAANYVPKKVLAQELTDCIEQVLAAHKASNDKQRLRGFITQLDTQFELDNDPALVRPVVANVREEMENLELLERTRVRVSIAFEEALLKVLYEGNLGIGPCERRYAGTLHRLVEERRQASPFRERRLHLEVHLSRSEAVFVIGSNNPDFDFAPLANPGDPAHLTDPSSRGAMLIQTFMDEVVFDAARKELCLCKRTDSLRKECA